MAHPWDLHNIIMAMSLIMSTCIFDVCQSQGQATPLAKFTSWPGDRLAIGETLSLSCSSTGPALAISLRKKARQITSTIAYQSDENRCKAASNLRAGAWVPPCRNKGWNLTVVIPEVEESDSAEYICDVTTLDLNTHKSKAYKTVTIIVPPRIPSISGSLKVIENNRLSLSCDGATDTRFNKSNVKLPVLYRWKRQGLFLQDTPSLDLRSYIVDQVNPDQAGSYTCVAVNDAGQTESAAVNVDIYYLPKTVTLTTQNQPHLAGATLEFRCTASTANPRPNLRLMRLKGPDTTEIFSDVTLQFTRAIVLKSADNQAQFYCEASSEGEIPDRKTTSAKLTIEMIGAPDTPSNLRVVDVTARSITLSWTSESSGGSPQKFHIMFKRAFELWPKIDQIVNIDDPGYKSTVRYRISDLDPLTWYVFRVRASNQHPVNNNSDYTSIQHEQTIELPKTEDLRAYRAGNEITVSWRQPIGKYTGVTIEYCITATAVCSNYSVPDISENTATLTVDEGKTYIYYLHLLQTDDVLFTSAPFHAVQAPFSFNIGYVAGGAGSGLLIIVIVVINIVICCRWRKAKTRKHEIITNCNNGVPMVPDYLSFYYNTTPQHCVNNDLRSVSLIQHPHYHKQVNVASDYEVPVARVQQPEEHIYCDANVLSSYSTGQNKS